METNAICSICGRPYHVCSSCLAQKSFKPWRTITDSIEHYKIYMALHGYTLTKDKANAKMELQNCDLSDLDTFKPQIQSAIKEICSE